MSIFYKESGSKLQLQKRKNYLLIRWKYETTIISY